jgi:hypothetical protein
MRGRDAQPILLPCVLCGWVDIILGTLQIAAKVAGKRARLAFVHAAENQNSARAGAVLCSSNLTLVKGTFSKKCIQN